MWIAVNEPGNTANTKPLRKKLADLHDFIMVEPQSVERLRFGKGFIAPNAAVTLDDAILIFETAKPLSFTVTAMTVHLTL